MTAVPQLLTHQEKVRYIRKYLNDILHNYENSKPLLIVGPGASGKTKVLHDVCNNLPVPLLIIQNGKPSLYLPDQITEDMKYHHNTKKAIIIVSLGEREDMDMANYMDADIVYFNPDPSMSR